MLKKNKKQGSCLLIYPVENAETESRFHLFVLQPEYAIKSFACRKIKPKYFSSLSCVPYSTGKYLVTLMLL